MAGMLTLDELRKAVGAGEIDTVLAVQVDMQGRLMGKRFQAEYFLDSASKETHSCNYLLATDMEMHTVEGYKATSWAAGYGDYIMKPDLATLRRIPWLEGTALVLCDAIGLPRPDAQAAWGGHGSTALGGAAAPAEKASPSR